MCRPDNSLHLGRPMAYQVSFAAHSTITALASGDRC